MSSPAEWKASYRRLMDAAGETVVLRRYSGTPGARTHADVSVRGRVTDFEDRELIGDMVQGDRKIILLAEDIETVDFDLPLRVGANDKIVVRGKELAIKAVDDSTARVQGTLVALLVRAGA